MKLLKLCITLDKSIQVLKKEFNAKSKLDYDNLNKIYNSKKNLLDPLNLKLIKNWDVLKKEYKNPLYKYKVRNKEISIQTKFKSLSNSNISKVSLPSYEAWGDILKWQLTENLPEISHTHLEFSLLKEKMKIQQECLRAKVVQSEQIKVSLFKFRYAC